MQTSLETKFSQAPQPLTITDEAQIKGYASLFNQADQNGDIVVKGAYAASLARLKAAGRSVKMLWQHDPCCPIGMWDEIFEDDTGLFVSGRLLTSVQKGREALDLVQAGALDGLSIGYKTVRAEKRAAPASGRKLLEIDLWEVSLVTFPMLGTARIQSVDAPQPAQTPSDTPQIDLTEMIETLRAGTEALRKTTGQ